MPQRINARALSCSFVAGILLTVLAIPTRSQGDGIAVGKPKVFDNRALTLMLERLNQSLAQVQVVDQKSLSESLGLFQGSQTQEVSRSLSISTLPLPEIKTTSQANSAGQLIPSQQATDRAAVNPSSPGLPDALAAPGFQPKFGPSANDLLSDQVNLTYQIFNLRMLLERSLSDRLWQDPAIPGRIGQRLQAVIGFDITIDPPKGTKNCAAIVEITIAPKDSSYPVSLVAMMPQEKTYNSAALDSHSSAFGGSAVVKMITIGYSERHRGQIFYLFRDTDTISVERMNNPPGAPANAITFGWQFRPVLGRKSVSPGARQLFAVLALPDFDKYLTVQTVAPPTAGVSAETYRENTPPPFNILVWRRVYWRKYDSKTLTTSAKKKEIPGAATVLCDVVSPCPVPYTATIQGSLQPHLRDVKWSGTDDKNATVTVVGDNFFSGTNVYLGGATLDSEKTGLLIKSDQDLTLRTTLGAIASGDAVLNGRYSKSVPVEIPPPASLAGEIWINSVIVDKLRDGSAAKITLELTTTASLGEIREGCNPVLQVGSTVLPPPYIYSQSGGHIVVKVQAPNELVIKGAIVKVKCPFREGHPEGLALIQDPSDVKATLLGTEDKTKVATLAIEGVYFDQNWAVQLDQRYPVSQGSPAPGKLVLEGSKLLFLEVGSDVLKGYKNLLLLPPNGGQPIVVQIPEPSATPAASQPKLTCTQPIAVEQYSSRSVICSGEGLSTIAAATFENLSLTFKPVSEKGVCTAPVGSSSDKAECLRVFLTRQVTRKPGPIEVLLHTKDEKFVVPLKVMVEAAAAKPAPQR
jgi:hypothetical protein